MTYKVGIMQGRFTSKKGFYPQQFPWDNWENEFAMAKDKGIDYIEWMFNAEKYRENPLLKNTKRLKEIMLELGVRVNSVCMNYFIVHSIWDYGSSGTVMEMVIEKVKELGIKHIIIPLFEESCLVSEEHLNKLICYLSRYTVDGCFDILFETDFDVKCVKHVLDRADDKSFGICYDLGNAAGNGRDVIKEIKDLEKYIGEFHIKDKELSGGSVMIGAGCVPYELFFKGNNLNVPLILESYFGEDAVGDTTANITQLRSYIK
jgi:sugar phosphate isomerase/epimerase